MIEDDKKLALVLGVARSNLYVDFFACLARLKFDNATGRCVINTGDSGIIFGHPANLNAIS